MVEDWKTYCLMSGIAFIEEMKKPYERIQIKSYKNVNKKYKCFNTIEFNQKNKNTIFKWWEITRKWEKRLNLNLLGNSFKEGLKYNKTDDRYYIIFSPEWLFEILKTTGKIPSNHNFKICKKRLLSMTERRSGSRYIISKKSLDKITSKNLYDSFFFDKFLAAGAFIISFDLEFRGVYSSNLRLTMSNKYWDFLEFMLNVAKKHDWSLHEKLNHVNINSSLKMGIKASPQKEFGIKNVGVKEIYEIAGPLIDETKNKFIRFHINRIKNKSTRSMNVKEKILLYLSKEKQCKTRDLMIPCGVRRDVVLDHLRELEKNEILYKKRKGKGYIWNLR